MRLDYFFWNNLKKQGYSYGRLVRPLYNKTIENGTIDEVNTFITANVERVLANQKQQSEKSIANLDKDINQDKYDVRLLIDKKINEQEEITESYDMEKEQNDKDYELYLSADLEKIQKANNTLDSFFLDIQTYTQDAKEKIQGNINTLLDTLSNVQKENLSITHQEASKALNQNMDGYINIKDRTSGAKDIVFLIFLFFVCVYDTFLGYKVIHGFLAGDINGIRLNIRSAILAILFVVILIGFTHFIVKSLETPKNKTHKNLMYGMLAIIIFALILYIRESAPELSIKQLFSGRNANRIETIFRMLLIPALVVGEIIIARINWDNVFLYRKNILKPIRYVYSLIAKGVYVLKKQELNKYIKQEKQIISELADDINVNLEKSFSFSGVMTHLSDIKSLLGPVFESHEKKLQEWKTKTQMIVEQRQSALNELDNRYKGLMAKYESNITLCEQKKSLIRNQLGNAENSVGDGIRIGLTS